MSEWIGVRKQMPKIGVRVLTLDNGDISTTGNYTDSGTAFQALPPTACFLNGMSPTGCRCRSRLRRIDHG